MFKAEFTFNRHALSCLQLNIKGIFSISIWPGITQDWLFGHMFVQKRSVNNVLEYAWHKHASSSYIYKTNSRQKCVDLKFEGSAWIVLTRVLLCVILLEFVFRPFTTAIIEIYIVSLNLTYIVNGIFAISIFYQTYIKAIGIDLELPMILTNQKWVYIIHKYFRKCCLIKMLCNVRLFSNPDTHISIVKLISDI